jgi:hypothetical protein
MDSKSVYGLDRKYISWIVNGSYCALTETNNVQCFLTDLTDYLRVDDHLIVVHPISSTSILSSRAEHFFF